MTDEEKKQKVYELIYHKDRLTYSVRYETKYGITREEFERFGDELVAEGKATKEDVGVGGGQTGNKTSIDWGPGYSGF